MRFLGQFRDELFFKRYATLMPANLGQQSVIKPLAPTQPATGKVETYARYKNQVQLV
jgi:hypothetical protein